MKKIFSENKTIEVFYYTGEKEIKDVECFIILKDENKIFNGLYDTFLCSKETFYVKYYNEGYYKEELENIKYTPLKIYKDKVGEYVFRYPHGKFYTKKF